MSCVVLVPAYQNLATLPRILEQLTQANLPVIVVDDASTDGTAQWLDQWCNQGGNRWKITLKSNAGKGNALALGLAEAARKNFDATITIDADGQHRVEDALALLADWKPGQLLLGARNETALDYPATSLFGRRLWSLGMLVLTGLEISDPVCGLRVYPNAHAAHIHCRSGRYAWEEEFILHAARRGVVINELTITTVYLPPQTRVSHYKLFRDWTESLFVFTTWFIRSIAVSFPLRHRAQSLRHHGRSFRRLLGITVFVSGIAGLATNWWIGAIIIAWLAWKLQTLWIVAVATTITVALLSNSLSTYSMIFAILITACVLTQAVRPLCKN